jgi:cytochrome c oxidase assembly protein subunit 15
MSETLRRRRVRRLALLTCGLSVAVVAVSAWLRLEGAGLGCAEWPGCYGTVLTGLPPAPWVGARLLHRLVATAALLAGILLAWRSLRPQPLGPAGRDAAALLALMLFLSVVGIWSADPRQALVNFVNIVGGLGLVSFSWRVALGAVPQAPEPLVGAGRLLRAGLALVTAAVLSGALIGARYAATACASLPGCEGTWWPAAAGWPALHPFSTLTGPMGPGDAGGAALHLVHRYCALAALALLALAAWRLRTRVEARPVANLLLGLLAAEMLLGVATVLSGFGLALAVAHNVGAALVLAGAASLLRRLA